MSESSLPERISWAIEVLDVRPDDRILEIGAGRGLAAAIISERLARGSLTAIDRSEKAIHAARQRLAEPIAAGRVVLERMALEEADLPPGSFTKAFAINVNHFWVADPAAELARVERLLRPGGRLYLFYEPPTPSQAELLAGKLSAAAVRSGFRVVLRQSATRRGVALLGVIISMA